MLSKASICPQEVIIIQFWSCAKTESKVIVSDMLEKRLHRRESIDLPNQGIASFFFLCTYGCFACIDICIPLACLVPVEGEDSVGPS